MDTRVSCCFIKNIVSAIFSFKPGRQERRCVSDFVIAGFILLSCFYMLPRQLIMPNIDYSKILPSNHGIFSVFLATNKVLCKRDSMLSLKYYDTMQHKIFEKEILNTPLLKLPKALLNDSEAANYCNSLEEYQNNENTLVKLHFLLLQIYPEISLHQAVESLAIFRLLIVGVVLVILFALGFSLFLSVSAGILILGANCFLTKYFPLSQYPFLLDGSLLYITLVSFGLNMKLQKNITLILFSMVLGFIAALLVNLRTSFLPLTLVGALVYFLAQYFANKKNNIPKNQGKLIVVTAVVFMASFFISHFNVFSLYNKNAKVNFNHHPIVHSLVLGLANNDNELAKREGIEWNDSVGVQLAQQIDPQVTGLDSKYERTLFVYYKQLWSKNTTELASIYVERWYIAFQTMFQQCFSHVTAVTTIINKIESLRPPYSFFQESEGFTFCLLSVVFLVFVYFVKKRRLIPANILLLAPVIIIYLVNNKLYLGGMYYSFLFSCLIILAYSKKGVWNTGIVVFIALLSVASALMLLESIIIMPNFSPIYYITFLVYVVFVIAFYSEFIMFSIIRYIFKHTKGARSKCLCGLS